MSSYRGKHREQSNVARTVTQVALAGAIVAAPMALAAGTANASTNWDAVAQCESSGNWSIHTGNGFSGGLQFTNSTWAAYGGTAYAPQAWQASREAQIAVAERVLAGQGPNAWPVCYGRGAGGVTSGGHAAAPAPQRKAAPAPQAQRKAAPAPQAQAPYQAPKLDGNGDYTVVAGDTLSGLVEKLHLSGTWQDLYNKNKDVVGSDPNLIIVGQKLATK